MNCYFATALQVLTLITDVLLFMLGFLACRIITIYAKPSFYLNSIVGKWLLPIYVGFGSYFGYLFMAPLIFDLWLGLGPGLFADVLVYLLIPLTATILLVIAYYRAISNLKKHAQQVAEPDRKHVAQGGE